MQLIIPALVISATPAHLFIARLKAENQAKFSLFSEIDRMTKGRKWLDERT